MKPDNLFQNKKPVLSFEIFPPKRDSALLNIDATLEVLCELKPDFISVTFGAGGSITNNLTLELAKRIKNVYHIEPLVHLTCLTYSREEISRILAELKENGIENVLALRGDKNPDIEPKKDFCYASDLIAYMKQDSYFHVSAACYPEGHIEASSPAQDLRYLKQKVECGAEHLISQLFFDNQIFYDFVRRSRETDITVPIEAGIMPVVNKAQIERMVTLCGASLPDKFERILRKYENHKEALFDAGMAYAINQIVELVAQDVDGIHLYTMNNPAVAERICNGIRNLIG